MHCNLGLLYDEWCTVGFDLVLLVYYGCKIDDVSALPMCYYIASLVLSLVEML